MDFLDCKICRVPFDEDEHQPRQAPCGHGLCSSCLRALIKGSTFECPKCRQKNQVFVPEDLPINFDLIDVIRSFRAMKASLAKASSPSVPSESNNEICKVHHRSIRHRCLRCQMWICDNCLDSHSEFVGCSTISSYKAMESIRDKHTNNVDILLTVFEDDTTFMLSKIKDHSDKIKELNDKKKEIMEKVKQHSEEINKLQNVLEQGSTQKENLVKSKDHLAAVNSPYAMMDGVEILTHMKQSLRSWSVKNLGTDTPLGILKALKGKKIVYTEMVIKNEKMHAKLSKHEENIYIHFFRKQTIADGSTCMPFDRLQKMIPSDASLVFLELSRGGTVKGRVLIRLNTDLPNIREHVVNIATGLCGDSLSGGIFNQRSADYIGAYPYNFSNHSFTNDNIIRKTGSEGDVFAYFGSGYLDRIYIHVLPTKSIWEGHWRIFGRIEEGLDMLLDLLNKNTTDVKISDCGLVIEQE